MFISIYTLHLSLYTVSFWHGVIVSLFIMENWTLLKDLNAATKPTVSLVGELTSKIKDIDQLKKDNYDMEMRNKCLEIQVRICKEMEKLTFSDCCMLWKIRQNEATQSKRGFTKRKYMIRKSVSLQDLMRK